MLKNIISILIWGCILFFGGKFVYQKFFSPQEANTRPNAPLSAQVTSKAVTAKAQKEVLILLTKEENSIEEATQLAQEEVLNKINITKEEMGSSNSNSQGNVFTQMLSSAKEFFTFKPKEPEAKALKDFHIERATKKAIEEVMLQKDNFKHNYRVVEQATPAPTRIIGSIKSPARGVDYELTSVGLDQNGDIRVAWNLKNQTGAPIYLNSYMKKKLSPASIRLVDFSYQSAFTVKWYPDQTPVANCMLSDMIPPFGRVQCTAVVGKQLDGNEPLRGSKLQVYLPGKLQDIKVYLNS